MRWSIVVATAALAAAQSASPAPTPDPGVCIYNAMPGVTFNVCNLGVYNQDYIWNDPFDYDTNGTWYIFNIGLNANKAAYAPCLAQSTSPAYQVAGSYNSASSTCYALSTDVNNRLAASASLLDGTNPAKGFQLQYRGGNQCAAGTPPASSATFTIGFGCHPTHPFPAAASPTVQPVIEMSATDCAYQAYSFSTAGCPIQCPVVNGQVCGGNGVCGYDVTASTARCFCNNNYLLSDCSMPATSAPSGSIAGATIGGILVGLALIMGVSYVFGRRASSAKPQVSSSEGFYPSS